MRGGSVWGKYFFFTLLYTLLDILLLLVLCSANRTIDTRYTVGRSILRMGHNVALDPKGREDVQGGCKESLRCKLLIYLHTSYLTTSIP